MLREAIPQKAVDEAGALRHFSDRIGLDYMQPEVREKIRSGLKEIIARLQEGMAPGDELYFCSWNPAPLIGHFGLGIVRDGKVTRYEMIGSY